MDRDANPPAGTTSRRSFLGVTLAVGVGGVSVALAADGFLLPPQ